MGANNKSRSNHLDTILADPSILETTLRSEGIPGIKRLLGSSYSKVLRSRGLWEYFTQLRTVHSGRTYQNSTQGKFTSLLRSDLEKVHRLYLEQGYSALEKLFHGHVARAFACAGLTSILEQWKSEPHYTKPVYGQNPDKAKEHAQLFLNPDNLEKLHRLYLEQGSDALSKALGSDNIGNCFKTFNMYHVWVSWQTEPHRTYHSFSTSKTEQRLQDFLESFGIRVLRNQRFLAGGREIDLYLPDYKIGIEVNGVQFHLTGDPVEKFQSFTRFHTKTYHSEKTTAALQSGVALYHYWSFQSLAIFQSALLAKLGRVQKIYARELVFRPLTSVENHNFFQANHIDGSTVSRGFGLVDLSGKIYCALALRHQPRSKLCEIARFANLLGYQVVGGYSKLIAHAVPVGTPLVSYCNRDLSPDYTLSVYPKLGFKCVGDTGPILRYWLPHSVAGMSPGVYDRRVFQKNNLRRLFPDYVGEPIDAFLRNKEIFPLHNSGNWKFTKNID